MIMNKTKGFTLLETLIAVAIMMVAISSAFGLAPEGLVGARFAKNQTTATYLAQEAIEAVRNIRDNAMFFAADPLDPQNWLKDLLDCVGQLCTIDVREAKVSACISDCSPLDVLVEGDKTSYVSHIGTVGPDRYPSIFTREIIITPRINSKVAELRDDTGEDTEALITVRVRWKEGTITKVTEMNEFIFDWWTFTK